VGKKSSINSFEGRLYNYIVKYFHVPTDSIVRSKPWLESSYRFVRSNNQTFQTVLDSINSEWVHMSLEDMLFFWQGKEYIFWLDESWIKVNGKRYDVETSVKYAEEMLMYQFGCMDGVKQFLQDLLNILDRRLPKKNAFEIESAPSSGKNYFIDPILLYMGSFGQITNCNRNNQFAFDNCFNKRVCLMNEPKFENSFRESLLMLFAGDTFSAQGKYKNVADIVKTPVIVLTNASPFSNSPQWNDRMIRYRWKRCEFLKDRNYKLDPRFFLELCNKHGIQ
jgi:uncharacterized protein YacL (UPF0231 family)